MTANDAIPGKMYTLKKKDFRPNSNAECIGLNQQKDFVRFLVFDNWGKRQVILVYPNEEVREA